jgi:GNAT superfamily N-acetyltransferase
MEHKWSVNMHYTIRNVSSEEDLVRAIDFGNSIFEGDNPTLSYEKWLPHFLATPDLLIYVEDKGQILGTVFGRIGDNKDNITLGMVAVSPGHRRCGIGSALMKAIEVRALRHDFTTILLGAKQDAEPFYLKCGYTPFLFIQAPNITLDELRSLNISYPEAWSYEGDGWARLMITTPVIDRVLQQQYNERFPYCSTQTVFIKHLT